jgi:hypothetical protein
MTDPKIGPQGPLLVETLVTGISLDEIKTAKFDEKKNCYYLTWDDTQYLGSTPAQSLTRTNSP